jgi:hypothetical protein
MHISRWRSILVRGYALEGGAKNPSEGTSMKFLGSAFDAQSGAFPGSKEAGAICNGMQALTLTPRRPRQLNIRLGSNLQLKLQRSLP